MQICYDNIYFVFFRLFCDNDRLTSEAMKYLCVSETDGVKLFPYSAVTGHIIELVESTTDKIWVSGWVCQWV